jgi:hypothetical protein
MQFQPSPAMEVAFNPAGSEVGNGNRTGGRSGSEVAHGNGVFRSILIDAAMALCD